jgi:hypothetical protein
MDLGVGSDISRKLFFRLLDAHIMSDLCSAAVALAGGTLPDDLPSLELAAKGTAAEALDRLGGPLGVDLWRHARQADSEIHDLLDSVVPISWEGVVGHGTLYSLRALSSVEITIGGTASKVRPLIMFDDGQELATEQRRLLLDVLTDRELSVARWYTERHSALTDDEVVGDGEPGRGHHILPLESKARSMGGQIRNGRRLRAFEAMLIDVADRRARKPLADYADETDTEFAEFLDGEDSNEIDKRSGEASLVVRQRVLALAGGTGRYDEWLASAEPLGGYEAASRWRELEILITRDRDRTQLALLDLPLSDGDLKAASGSSIREAAALFLRQEFRLPYYFGSQRLARLGSQNVEQFLALSGDLFDEMLALVTLGQRPWIDPIAQDRIVRATSDAYWRSIPQRRSYGRDIQHLLLRIGTLARRDTYRPKAPYAPGVTGTALSMRDRARLLDPAEREKIPGAESLFRALAGAIGHNLLFAELNRSVKNDQWMVLYLNRMLCARFGLPIGYGGFRERPLIEMCEWMSHPTPGDLSGIEVPSLFDT